jgi:hypothetical protein
MRPKECGFHKDINKKSKDISEGSLYTFVNSEALGFETDSKIRATACR